MRLGKPVIAAGAAAGVVLMGGVIFVLGGGDDDGDRKAAIGDGSPNTVAISLPPGAPTTIKSSISNTVNQISWRFTFGNPMTATPDATKVGLCCPKPGDGASKTFTPVADSGGKAWTFSAGRFTGVGTITPSVNAGVFGNATRVQGPSVSYELTGTPAKTVTFRLAQGQTDPTSTSPVKLEVAIGGITPGTSAQLAPQSVSFDGSTEPTMLKAGVTTKPNSPSVFIVSVTGMTKSGIVKASVKANAMGGGNKASTGTNSVTYNKPAS